MPTASIVKGRGYLNHNDRTIKQVNSRSWKAELSSRNIVYVNEPIQNVYHELFDSALENYNQSQIKKNHPERKIKDYYEHISRSKQEQPFYEYIVAFGNVNDKNTEIYPVLQQCLDEYNRGFQSRNPNFRVIQQITHRDEIGIDHTHIDIVPVCSGNTRGLSVKNSFRGALKEMGYTGKTAFLDWRQSEEKYMAEILERHGLEFERGSGRDEHLNVRQYQAEAREINRLAQQKLKNMELPSIPEPEIKTNPITKSESVKLSKAEFDKIKQVIDYQQTQITSLEAQKSDLSAKLKNVESKLDIARKKPYMRENETLMQNLQDESDLSEELTKKYGKLSNQYVDLVKSYKKLEKENGILHEKNTSLEKENSSLFKKIRKLEMEIGGITQDFHYKLTRAYVSIKNIVQAIGMLKYEELTAQERQHFETLQKKSTEIQHDLDQLNTLKQNLLKEIESLEVRKSNLEKTLLLNGLEKRTGR